MIAELVIKHGSVTIDDIVKHTGVSTMTAYRDVRALEEAGLLQLHRGQVSAAASGLQEASAVFRLDQEPESKAKIARRVAELIPTGSSVALDDSTSGVYVIRELARSAPMTVITNSLLVAREAAQTQDLHLFVTGGTYEGWADALLGPTAISTLAGLDVDFCVLSASGISDGRCFHPYESVVQVKKAMMRSARTKVLALDHTKLQRKALHTFARLDEFDHVIVDPGIEPTDLQRLTEWGAQVTIASP
ncbi:MAG TPA: DeoR/GlpR family DNA-binding transcription regulator [Arachnia sp.]|nr:DeoR/GlpR family DNA-binding transcription regulator [Arachnia sp.]